MSPPPQLLKSNPKCNICFQPPFYLGGVFYAYLHAYLQTQTILVVNSVRPLYC